MTFLNRNNNFIKTFSIAFTLLLSATLFSANAQEITLVTIGDMENIQDQNMDYMKQIHKITKNYPAFSYEYTTEDGKVTDVTVTGVEHNMDRKRLEVVMFDLESSKNMLKNKPKRVGVFYSVDDPAEYKGDLNTTLISNLKYPAEAKDLYDKTPEMLRILTSSSQFEQQKSIIDHEWKLINQELEQLQKENTLLLAEQMNYFDISKQRYETRYLRATLDSDREQFKNECRKSISDKIATLDRSPETKGKWLGQVEIYMYKVQSLRLRFGQLTMRMMANIDQYESLLNNYSDPGKFPLELTTKIVSMNSPLNNLRNKFYSSFNPAKYVEDSAVMYIERQ